MSNRFWFRPKRYGYGFFPISWEGWLMTTVFIGVLLGLAWLHHFFDSGYLPSSREALSFGWDLIVATTIFSLLAVKKTNGELKWNWSWEDKKVRSTKAKGRGRKS